VDDATEFDGTIEGAIAHLIQEEPEESEEALEEPSELPSEDEQEEAENVEDDSEDDSEDESAEDEDDTDESEDSAPEVFTVKVDGKETEVTLDELKRGYSGQQYVQKGMEEAAELRKQAEQAYEALLNERQQIRNVYEQLQSGGMPTPPKEPSREQFDSDPIGYMEAKLAYDEQVAEYNQKVSQLQQVAAQQTQAEEQAKRAYMQREVETLQAVEADFASTETAKVRVEKMTSLGKEVYGFTPEEISQVMDHRALRVLNDAVKYRELMASKGDAIEKAKPKNRKPIKAGAKKVGAKSNAERTARQKLKKSGRIDDALDLILQS